MERKIITFIIFSFLLARLTASAQGLPGEAPKKVESLGVADRLSFGFNATDVALLTPNVSAEWIIGDKNYSRWSVGLSYKLKWDTHDTYVSGWEFRRSEIRADVRNYWRNIDLSAPEFQRLPKRHFFLPRLFSQRRSHVKHPNTVFYRGFYTSYGSYSYLFTSKGHQGTVVQAGVLGGIIKPLYVYPSGHSVSLDLGLSIGAAMVEEDEFRHDREDNCYPFVKHTARHVLPFLVISDIHVGFVFRMGKKTLPELYRRRYEVDEQFRDAIDSINDMCHRQRLEHYYADSLYNMVLDEFEHLYDSISRAQEAKQQDIPASHAKGSGKNAKSDKRDSKSETAAASGGSDQSALQSTVTNAADDKAARKKEEGDDRKKEEDDE